MKRPFDIVRSDIFNKKVDTPEGTASIINKYKNEMVEINNYFLKRDNTFHLKPPLEKSSIKTYWILSGSIYSIETKEVYGPGNLIVLHHDNELFHVVANEDTLLLVHSINEESYSRTEDAFRYIYGILQDIQKKDEYTFDHSMNVFRYCVKVGQTIGYTGSKYQNLAWAAKYHDIGKIYVPDRILNKPSTLDESEFRVMKTHVEAGKSMILDYFNPETYITISQHHERIDGSGYPYGLKDNEICEEAKIIAVCDSYDAMTSDRVYKKGKSKEEAIEELKSLAGIKYDPRIVELFIKSCLN